MEKLNYVMERTWKGVRRLAPKSDPANYDLFDLGPQSLYQ